MPSTIPASRNDKQIVARAYNRWSQVWGAARYLNHTLYAGAASQLEAQHQRILDVGCGTGILSRRLAKTGREVLGLDLSPSMIRRARCCAPHVEFEVGDAEHLPFPNGTFDAVTNLISIHHYPNAFQAVREFRRVLRPGGRLVLIAFDGRSRYIHAAQAMNPWMRNVAGVSWQKTPEELTAMITAASFVCVRQKSVCYPIRTVTLVADTPS